MKRRYVLTITLGLLSLLLWRCNQDDPNIKSTAGEAIAGEWYVTYKVGTTDVNGGYSPIITSNTAANVATEMLISDYVTPTATSGNFWSFKVKAQVDPANKTFAADEAVSSALWHEDPYPIKVNVLNGSIFKDGGHSKTGVTVDSIYFELQFEDDSSPFGTTYIVSGHKRTGFAADDF
jgi:hypothetical protein